MEKTQEQPITDPKEMSPEALHAWIVEELGDSEIAQKVEAHPELTELYVQGEGYPCVDFFEMSRAIGKEDSNLEQELLSVAAHNNRLMPLTYDLIVGNMPISKQNYLIGRQSLLTESVQVQSEDEQEKSKEVLVAIDYATNRLNEIRASYGLSVLTIDPAQIRMISQKYLPGGQFGTMNLLKQNICIESLDKLNPVLYFNIFHELVHLLSYGAIQGDLLNDIIKVTTYRVGVNVTERYQDPNIMSDNNPKKLRLEDPERKEYLLALNEAMTEEISNRIIRTVPPNEPDIGQELQSNRREVYKILENNPELLKILQLRPHWIKDVFEDENGIHVSSTYKRERILMFDLLRKIAERNPTMFEGLSKEESEEELFEMLQKAMFTGNILPFGRLFNETFGRKKFREYGHLQTFEEQEEFIANL